MTATEDLFTPIHKGLRSMIYDLSSRLQTNDFANTGSTETLATDLEHEFEVARSAGCALCVLAHHAGDEETFIFGDAARVDPPLIAKLLDQHRDLTRRELEVQRRAREIAMMQNPGERVLAGIGLNQTANELFSAYFSHMNLEETDLVPQMKEHFTDTQMVSMRGAIMGRMPPDRLFAILRWMLPSLNVTELSELLRSVRPGVPPPVYQKVTDLCEARVNPALWAEVKSRIGT